MMMLGGFNGLTGVPLTTHALQTQTLGTWGDQGSAARIDDDGPNPNPAVTSASPLTTGEWNGIAGTVGIVASVTAFCGGTVDIDNKRVLMSGGGHGDYKGNGTTAFNYTDLAAEDYTPISWPSATIASDDSGINPDGTPDSRHTYSAMCVYNGHLYMSGAAVNVNANGAALFWRQNLSTGAWAGLTASDMSALNNPYATGIVYDPTSGLLWGWNNTDLFTVDPADFTSSGVTQRLDNLFSGSWSFNSDTAHTMALDVSKSKILVIGYVSATAEAVVFDISTPSSTTSATPTWTGTGAAAYKAETRAGLTYDSKNEDLVGWIGGTSVYTINLSTSVITSVAAAGGNSVTPTDMTANGVCGRFAYDSNVDAFILINGDESAYYYKRA